MSACGSAASSSSPADGAQVGAAQLPSSKHVSLTLVSYLPLIGQTGQTTLNGLLAGFKKAQPNISVTVQVPSATNGAAITAVVQRDEAAGTTPDVVQSGLDMLRYLATGGLGAQDLGSHRHPVRPHRPGVGRPAPVPARRPGPLGKVDGKLYAIPWVLSTPILFYNAKLFTKAGLNPRRHRPRRGRRCRRTPWPGSRRRPAPTACPTALPGRHRSR